MEVYHCNTWIVVTLCLAFCLNVLHVQGRWVNGFDQPFDFTCSRGNFLQTIVSVHSNHHEDRRFYLNCRQLPCGMPRSVPTCSWTGYVNNFDEAVSFRCPGNQYIAGISSYHNNHYEDRRFRFYCCQTKGIKLVRCSKTGYVNGFDDLSGYSVPEGRVLKGMSSYHDNGPEDRRFQYEACYITRNNCQEGRNYQVTLGFPEPSACPL